MTFTFVLSSGDGCEGIVDVQFPDGFGFRASCDRGTDNHVEHSAPVEVNEQPFRIEWPNEQK